MTSSMGRKDEGVFELLTELCTKTALQSNIHNKLSQKHLMAKMRSHAYSIILKKNSEKSPETKAEPMSELWSYYFVCQQNVKNVAEHRKTVELKRTISKIKNTDFGERQDNVYNILRLLVCLKNSVKDDSCCEIFKRPFSFGRLDEMLPKLQRETFGSPEPYHYYPSHVFELPFSLRCKVKTLDEHRSTANSVYIVESFGSKSHVTASSTTDVDIKSFMSPLSLPSMSSTHVSPYSDTNILNYPRLTGQRDLQIPQDSKNSNCKVSLVSTNVQPVVKEVFRSKTGETVDIWELASQVDKDLPEDIWEVVSKMPIVKERRLIATSSREMSLWRRVHSGQLCDLDIVPERQFIRHIMYLIIGIETSSFPFSREYNCFYIKQDLILEGISMSHIKGYARDLLLIGTYYKRLSQFAFNHSVEDHLQSKGLVYEAAREVVRRYLLDFRLAATEIYEECTQTCSSELGNCLPTLLQILYHMEPLKYEIETVASIYKMINQDSKSTIPHGAELMSYLFNEISLVTHRKTASNMFTGLFSVCKVYFRFIERFIFEGELDDWYNEFFIRKDTQYVNSRSKRYWDKGFHITQSVAVPEFLRVLAKLILLCGKSLRLLKLCNPNDPLVLLISSDHPRVQCCGGFEALERQQQLLGVYRTRCRFVSGAPASLERLLLRREAERKAAAEMASLKQAETMEKIVAERKRLAQLIVAEKQHSMKVLEAAMAETAEARARSRRGERARGRVRLQAQRAADAVDAKLRDDERNKIMEYYSKLNIEVEKSQIHTEWKMKRLQLDQMRTQLLTTEERNLRRERLEYEHRKNEMPESEASTTSISEVEEQIRVVYADSTDHISGAETGGTCEQMTGSTSSVLMTDISEQPAQIQNSEFEDNKVKAQTSSDVFSALCNAAKSIFGSRKSDYNLCDNIKPLDAQGNVVSDLNIARTKESKTSNDVIGGNLDDVYDNEQFLKMRDEAMRNKQKVMTHEFGQTDNENNQVKEPNLHIDEENNIDTPFAQAKRNKQKVLGSEFEIVKPAEKQVAVIPKTDAQKEAMVNKQKILGVEYNIPAIVVKKNEPANVAQEEALRNRRNMLGSGFEMDSVISLQSSPRKERAGLTLNLKPYSESSMATYDITTPNTAVTPGDLFQQLDLETPTTAEVPTEGGTTSDLFSPQSEGSKDFESAKDIRNKKFLSSNGFDFSLMDEAAESEVLENMRGDSVDNSLSKSTDVCNAPVKPKRTFFNLLEGTYKGDEFDPFGMKEIKKYSKEYFGSKMCVDSTPSSYTHPAIIMEEVKKKPYTNIFASHFGTEDDQECITSDNIATLTACLQRSVMLPLTYQLEVVNNAMLTYFLVNLDMYEHLRSLKDYFFLMDGEFSNSICRNLFSKLTKTVNPQELLNFSTLHNILDKALGSSIAHVHKFSENLSFTITELPLSLQHSSPDVLQCLSLTYAVAWPLDIILSHDALLRSARVFQFLLKMRRIAWVLAEDFQELRLAVKTTKQQSRKLLRSPQYISVQIYRHIMASLIRALDNYIVTTCILTSWTEFENDLKKARTLDDLYECHVVYIKKVLFRCLLNNRSTPVMKLLNDIFTVILKFSRVHKAGEWRQVEENGHFTHTNFGQLEELFHLFEKLAKYLHKVVTKLMECGYQRHLVELLTMVNLNEYYTPAREDANSSIVSIS